MTYFKILSPYSPANTENYEADQGR